MKTKKWRTRIGTSFRIFYTLWIADWITLTNEMKTIILLTRWWIKNDIKLSSNQGNFCNPIFSHDRIQGIAEQVGKDTSPQGTSHWSATGNRPIYELKLRRAGSCCRISLKSHRPLHDCSVLREAVPLAGQNATTFSLIWHGTSSCRIEQPGRLVLSFSLYSPMREPDIAVGIPSETSSTKTAWEV